MDFDKGILDDFFGILRGVEAKDKQCKAALLPLANALDRLVAKEAAREAAKEAASGGATKRKREDTKDLL